MRVHDTKETILSGKAIFEVAKLNVSNQKVVFVEILVPKLLLSRFEIHVCPNEKSSYHKIYSKPEDYLNPNELFFRTSGDLTKTNVQAKGWFILDIRCIKWLKIMAASDHDIVKVIVNASSE